MQEKSNDNKMHKNAKTADKKTGSYSKKIDVSKLDYRKKDGFKSKEENDKPKRGYRPDRDGFGAKDKMIRVERQKPKRRPERKEKTGPSSPRLTEMEGEFEKQTFKAGTMVYPIPAVMVTVGEQTDANIITIAWTGTICSDPPMLYISVRKERHSYAMLQKYGKFVLNLTTEDILYETDYCGVKSGKEVNKFKETKLEMGMSEVLNVPMILKSPVNIECSVVSETDYGSHTMFVAKVENVMVSKTLIDEKGRFNLQDAKLVAYSHGKYFALGEVLGTFGYSIKKKKKPTGKNYSKNK